MTTNKLKYYFTIMSHDNIQSNTILQHWLYFMLVLVISKV